eukprot:CAMPEP_0171075194 /NCGR_PEP_ID=MMETSP0766_2-20121228/12626_1 /TAXON_ID=439317 /ORGANISM="Gambierdiscus australes, Strain CAWD 149" /LENGTH=219 /DNA_ID=CAMNT_0011532041 /DNA_START=164 /DNA_END=820 /DNA_ORIENTATION=-
MKRPHGLLWSALFEVVEMLDAQCHQRRQERARYVLVSVAEMAHGLVQDLNEQANIHGVHMDCVVRKSKCCAQATKSAARAGARRTPEQPGAQAHGLALQPCCGQLPRQGHAPLCHTLEGCRPQASQRAQRAHQQLQSSELFLGSAHLVLEASEPTVDESLASRPELSAALGNVCLLARGCAQQPKAHTLLRHQPVQLLAHAPGTLEQLVQSGLRERAPT